jgi:hypothetical protein
MDSLVLLPTTGNQLNVTGTRVKGAGYTNFGGATHTVQVTVNNFVGRIFIEASLATEPAESDWFAVSLESDQAFVQYPRDPTRPTGLMQGDTGTRAWDFVGNYVWVRARLDRTYLSPQPQDPNLVGSVDQILLNYGALGGGVGMGNSLGLPITGPRGPAGFPGATGAAGEAALTGATGPRGVQGIRGATGADSTVTGPTGTQGIVGATGATGDRGQSGATGATGVQGATGTQGQVPQELLVYTTGAQDSTVTGPTGYTGVQGATGAPGEAASTGATGAPGSQGPTGATGVQGDGIIYEFTINYDGSGSPQSVTNLPLGWSVMTTSSTVVITHDVGTLPSGFYIWGRQTSTSDVYTVRSPNNIMNMSYNVTTPTMFTLVNVTATNVGTVSDGQARAVILFS